METKIYQGLKINNPYNVYGITAKWGYKELVFSEEHYDGLFEQEPEEIQLFLRRNNGIDNWT